MGFVHPDFLNITDIKNKSKPVGGGSPSIPKIMLGQIGSFLTGKNSTKTWKPLWRHHVFSAIQLHLDNHETFKLQRNKKTRQRSIFNLPIFFFPRRVSTTRGVATNLQIPSMTSSVRAPFKEPRQVNCKRLEEVTVGFTHGTHLLYRIDKMGLKPIKGN